VTNAMMLPKLPSILTKYACHPFSHKRFLPFVVIAAEDKSKSKFIANFPIFSPPFFYILLEEQWICIKTIEFPNCLYFSFLLCIKNMQSYFVSKKLKYIIKLFFKFKNCYYAFLFLLLLKATIKIKFYSDSSK
jgi:hypothetical protein